VTVFGFIFKMVGVIAVVAFIVVAWPAVIVAFGLAVMIEKNRSFFEVIGAALIGAVAAAPVLVWWASVFGIELIEAANG
jgi:hypothetical protein